MESFKQKLECLEDGTRGWKINSKRLVRIIEGEGKVGETGMSAMRPLPQLPVEVWENVINHLWDDQYALAQCSLVCRAWYPPCRFHLHRKIMINTVRGVKAYAKELKQTPELSKRAHDMFIGDFPHRIIDLSTLWPAAILLARKLPELERLRIWNSEWKPWTMHKDIFVHLSAFSVTRLDLHDVTFPSVTIFGRLVCALPCLVELECDNMDFTHDQFHRDTFGLYRNRVTIRSLWLEYPPLESEKLMDFLAHPCISSHLQRCIFRYDHFYHHGRFKGEFQRLLNAASGSLSELQLLLELGQSERQTDTEVSAAERSVLSLAHNISLQRLWLCLKNIPQDSDLDSFGQALLSIESNQLREIVIVFIWLSSPTEIIEKVKNMFRNHESAHHEEMDNYLSSDPFRTLSKVEFALSAVLDSVEAITAVEEQWKQIFAPLFPRLTERGILCDGTWVRRQLLIIAAVVSTADASRIPGHVSTLATMKVTLNWTAKASTLVFPAPRSVVWSCGLSVRDPSYN
ncbi:uncharacterized protein LAESUDRAFT_813848 [Laetiporus sulphureus 93-53]|uniref:F-box domain-containing protein n=1 Tax=Laetiporus sulphureus 93-53 TaxID=1314785 RepID=A0A165DIW9_9APHY|nr:uncharacterized protein LAESUDRAFT_813848 [Laetiporus sulphureus 93-53]KZT04982.1 hypothetical protein LAESUDRAFT_813848 [Laetiporus sulphureus 93-53]